MTEPFVGPEGTELSPSNYAPTDTPAPSRLFLGPRFLYALFRSERDSDGAPKEAYHEAAWALLAYIREERVPYRQLLLNGPVLTQGATSLMKYGRVPEVEKLFGVVAGSGHVRFEPLDERTVVDATTLAEDRDWASLKGGDRSDPPAFTDFLTAAQMRRLDVTHVAAFDGDYEALGEFTVVPYLGST